MKRCKFTLADGFHTCGRHDFNLHQECIKQGDLCDRHYFQAQLIQNETPCVWNYHCLGGYIIPCLHNSWIPTQTPYCPGCGHPVQVKQNEEE